MNIETLYHYPHGAYAYTNGPDTLRVRLRPSTQDKVECFVIWNDRCSSPECLDRITPMVWIADDGLFTYWEAELYEPHRRLRYAFQIREGAREVWYTEDGSSSTLSKARWGCRFNWPYLYQSQQIQIPSWVREAVIYEIFPERFANGDPTNDHPKVKEWTSKPSWDSFYGGDLAGIQQKLPYLQALGITALWLTPIFESPSNHKYDTTSYTNIDPYFGTEETFQQLLQACHEHGIRVVLDAVFNHSGTEFFAWKDVLEHGADSRYIDWFHIHDFPADWRKRNYHMFDHHGHMPKLNTQNPEVQCYLIEAAAKWTRMGVDGWRLDAAGEVDPSLWRAFRREIRASNPDAYIVGEIEHEAARWTAGDQFDGVQHYPLYRAILNFFLANGEEFWAGQTSGQQWDAATFDQHLGYIRSWYPTPVLSALLTALSTHDTPRYLTLAKGDTRKLRLAATFLFTYTGTPMLYYGEEVGMEGGPDPDCRRPMLWDREQQDAELLAFYRRLIALRRRHASLKGEGVWTCLAAQGSGTYAYLRGALTMDGTGPGGDVMLVVLHNSATTEQITIPLQAKGLGTQACWKDNTAIRNELDGATCRVANGAITLELHPYEGAILGLP